jgi:hypothetical protein
MDEEDLLEPMIAYLERCVKPKDLVAKNKAIS